ncbi:hypothetical protein BJV85_000022 [Clostridium acetobutylicum]|uniref:Uncharacterized protein n=1 Tax=Clostridium acetobutylicum (strain ATCC 824 / DSM 792 / JCM 1419 / IAM 19013 / LMG 5710 / NBRC 13948 / NRRL B-527 / VKM B-1787 / 2291 / W) TaxID=272562 RepID=Q97MR0_CLOAB|nr:MULTISPECIES: hypothetical protein [Clostridium]AAK78116.1 Hypothetical protein CA_C0132 [Clostridium acetobutylicum ATCC 824]ADZ19175.1 Conserved hypothetical protein [Clostridium acetobutylicum EA 2018]AEI31070.1 hypothetical protein SMB_G0133 [Clostridium acetobutylicum DSM 1731]AWV81822.1 hypothetical protein DK921_17385 [Clostridium acetobutylicum]MBC2395368.1 hypothetical protein [Clostridium acetobutylicum]
MELHQWVGAHVPTDVGSILAKGIYEIYKENPSVKIDKLLEETLLKMMDGGIVDIYCALSTIYSQLIEESFGSAPFRINKAKILSKLKNSLISNKADLKSYFEWEGMGKPEGMWSEVLRINILCEKHWNLSII